MINYGMVEGNTTRPSSTHNIRTIENYIGSFKIIDCYTSYT